jgi:hypothetical protein
MPMPSATSISPVLERVLLTLWVGGLWTTGFVLAPVLFSSFEPMVAGDIAGRLFQAMSWVGMGCGSVLLILAIARTGLAAWRDWRTLVLAGMLLIAVFGEFALAARMREIKLAMSHGVEGGELWIEFRRLHAVSGTLFVVESVLGLLLVVRGVRPRS